MRTASLRKINSHFISLSLSNQVPSLARLGARTRNPLIIKQLARHYLLITAIEYPAAVRLADQVILARFRNTRNQMIFDASCIQPGAAQQGKIVAVACHNAGFSQFFRIVLEGCPVFRFTPGKQVGDIAETAVNLRADLL